MSSEKHYHTISDIAEKISKKHTIILKNGRFRVGIAQKLVNIYLKLLWCYRWIPEPPHCPIDSIVLSKIGERKLKWTQMDGIAEYRIVIEKIRAHIQTNGHNISLAKWELSVWNNR